MSKIDDLIAQYCPNGVKKVKLGQLIDFIQPTKYIVKSTKYDHNYPIPVLTAGNSFILGYTNEPDGHYSGSKESPVIIFDDFTTSFHWVDFKFKVKSSAIKILTAKKGNVLRYLYFAMKNIRYKPSSHARHWISIYSDFEISLPPLPVQQEIVKILDTFTELEEELEEELEARKKQYNYYRDKLLSFESSQGVKWMTLGEVGDVKMCKRILKSQTKPNGEIPFYKIGTFGKNPDAFISQELYEQYAQKYPFPKKGDVLISASGTIGRTVVYDGKPAYFQDSNIVWIKNDKKIVSNKYLGHFYQIAKWYVSSGGTISRLYNDKILEKQESPFLLLQNRRGLLKFWINLRR
jgi:type I restriction enzyme S subunit